VVNVFDHAVISWRLRSNEQRPAQLASLRELRDSVEPGAARLAAVNATQEQARRLRELAEQIVELAGQDAGNSEAFQEADLEFHALMLEASRNEMFIALTQPIMGIMSGRALYGIMPDDPHVDTMQIHVELAAAISRGDADAAEDASRRLLRGVNDFMEM